jgi:hypothetical protein
VPFEKGSDDEALNLFPLQQQFVIARFFLLKTTIPRRTPRISQI